MVLAVLLWWRNDFFFLFTKQCPKFMTVTWICSPSLHFVIEGIKQKHIELLIALYGCNIYLLLLTWRFYKLHIALMVLYALFPYLGHEDFAMLCNFATDMKILLCSDSHDLLTELHPCFAMLWLFFLLRAFCSMLWFPWFTDRITSWFCYTLIFFCLRLSVVMLFSRLDMLRIFAMLWKSEICSVKYFCYVKYTLKV